VSSALPTIYGGDTPSIEPPARNGMPPRMNSIKLVPIDSPSKLSPTKPVVD
jgi:hypothetical protein